MTLNDRLIIKVPASSANLGPGFDSIGLALNLYLTLEVERHNKWECRSQCEELKDFPTDENHFICQVAIQTAANYGVTLPPRKIHVTSDIPLARGLGSSAAAIVAGIEMANSVGKLGLTTQEKLLLATKWEGHPDNVGASLFGGLVIGCYREKEVDMLSFTELPFEMVAMIPPDILLTKESREVLPTAYSQGEAIQASSTANLLVAALLSQNWALAGKMMENDLFHQPYRKPLIHSYSEMEQVAKTSGAFGVALSGAGPTVICFIDKGKGKQLVHAMKAEFPEMDVRLLSICTIGSRVSSAEEMVK